MKKLLILIFMFMLSLVSVNGALNDAEAYYSFDTDLTDDSGNGYDGTNGGTTSTTGIINNGINFATDDNFYISQPFSNGATELSICSWISQDSLSMYDVFYRITGSGKRLGLFSYTDNKMYVEVTDGSNRGTIDYTSYMSAGVYTHVCMVYDGTQGSNSDRLKIYFSGIERSLSYSGTIPSSLPTFTSDFYFGSTDSGANYFDGDMDEVAIYTRALSDSEVLQLYNNGDGLNPYSLTSAPIISTNISDYYNSSSISIQLNTSTNTNMSYYLNGSSEISICNNCNNSILNLSGLAQGNYSIIFSSNNEGGEINTTEEFEVDLTSPYIDVIGNLTQTTFEIDFSEIFAVYDNESGVASCNLEVIYLSNLSITDNNYNLSCDATQTFTRSGIYNGTVTVTDNAGNSFTNSTIGTITPFIYINYLNSSGDDVENYNYRIFFPDGSVEEQADNNNPIILSPVRLGVLDLGEHIVEFSKLGFESVNVTININSSSGGQVFNYSVPGSQIKFNIFDRLTNDLIEISTSIELQSTYAETKITENGTITFTSLEFINEQYKAIVTNSDYKTEEVIFTYSNQEVLEIDVYMINETQDNLGTIEYIIKDESLNFLGGVLCKLLEWKSTESKFITVGYTLSNEEGSCFLNVELEDKSYEVELSKEGYTTKLISSERFIIDGDTRTETLNIDTTEDKSFLDEFTIVFKQNIENNISTINYYISSSEQSFTAYLKYYKVIAGQRIENTSLSLSSNGFVVDFEEDYQINLPYDILVVASVNTSNGQFEEIGSFKYLGNESINVELSKYDLLNLITFIGLLIGASFIIVKSAEFGISIMIGIIWFNTAFNPTIITGGIAVAFTMMGVAGLWFAYKRRS